MKTKHYSSNQITLARKLRKNSTPWERKVWSLLKSSKFYGYKFRRQFPIGNYIVDFCCVSKRLILELDGSQHNLEANLRKDSLRSDFLETQGYTVFRIWNNEIEKNIEGVAEKILQLLQNNTHKLPTLIRHDKS